MKTGVVVISLVLNCVLLFAVFAPASWKPSSSSQQQEQQHQQQSAAQRQQQQKRLGVVDLKAKPEPVSRTERVRDVQGDRRKQTNNNGPPKEQQQDGPAATPGEQISSPLLRPVFKASEPVIDNVPDFVRTVIIEVGVHKSPEFAAQARASQSAFFLMVEPLEPQAALEKGCAGIEDRCGVIAAAVHNSGNETATFRVGVKGECSSLLPAGQRCGKTVATRTVSLLTLDEIIDKLLAKNPKLQVKLIALDCQGADFFAAASLRRHRKRVAAIIAECQDIPYGDMNMIYPDARSCAELAACMTTVAGFVHRVCQLNVEYKELNCRFMNVENKIFDEKRLRQIHHPLHKEYLTHIKHRAECPKEAWRWK